MMRRSTLARHVLHAIGLVAFLLLLAYLAKSNHFSFQELRKLSAASLLITFLCFVGTMFVATMMQVAVLNTLRKPTPLRHMFFIGAISYLINYIPFRPGTVAQAITLKKLANIGYVDFAVVAVVTKAAMMLAGIIAFLACLLIQRTHIGAVLTVAISLVLVVAIAIARALSSRGLSPHTPSPKTFLNELGAISSRPVRSKLGLLVSAAKKYLQFASFHSIFTLIELSAVLVALQSIRFLVLAYGTGHGLSVLQSIGLSGAAMAGYVINILPAGMGTKEGGVLFSSTLLGVSTASVSPVLIADRVLDLFSSVVLGVVAAISAYRHAVKKPNDH